MRAATGQGEGQMHFDIMGGLSAFGGGLASYIVPFLFVLDDCRVFS